MSFDKNPSDFYDDTIVNRSTDSKNIQTKILTQREVLNVADPDDATNTISIRPWRISFSIETSKVEIVFEVNNQISIGRSSKYDHPFDGIDLSPFGGHELGVSRFHAEISQNNEHIFITDKNSANGTLLNQEKLKPETKYIIRHGDKVRFGNMYVQIHFLTPVFQID